MNENFFPYNRRQWRYYNEDIIQCRRRYNNMYNWLDADARYYSPWYKFQLYVIILVKFVQYVITLCDVMFFWSSTTILSSKWTNLPRVNESRLYMRRTAIDIANLRTVLFGKVTILIVDAKAICPTTSFTFAMSWRSNNVGHEGSDRNYPHISLMEILGHLFNLLRWRFGILFYRNLIKCLH